MMKITPEQLKHAAELADRVIELEREKDDAQDIPMRLVRSMNFKVPGTGELIRKELSARIAAARKELADMGFELLPPAGGSVIRDVVAASGVCIETIRPVD